MKTVVIFGGSGFIGQNIIYYLVKKGYRIVVPYHRKNNEAKLRLFGSIGQVIPVKYNNLNNNLIYDIIKKADVLVNLKTIWREKKSYSYKKNILNFNEQLIDLINSINKKKHFIFFSGLGVSEKSLSLRTRYISKVEKYIKANMENYTIIRPSLILGKGDHFLTKLLPIFKISYFIPLFGSGNTKFNPAYIDDIAKATEKIIENYTMGKNVYELGGSEIFTYKEFYRYIVDCLNVRRVFFSIPFNFAKIIVIIMEKTPIGIITYDQLILLNQDNILSDKFKNFSYLGIQPKDTREIVKKIITN